MSMHTPGDWTRFTQRNANTAADLHRKAHTQAKTARNAHASLLHGNLVAYGDLHNTFDSKVLKSRSLVDTLDARKLSTEDSIAASKRVFQMLERMHHSTKAPQQLVTWQLDMRQRRPLSEQVRDPVEAALEHRKQGLNQVQQQLTETMRTMRGHIEALQDHREEVRHDLSHKTHALDIDTKCHRAHHRDWHEDGEGTLHTKHTGGHPRQPPSATGTPRYTSTMRSPLGTTGMAAGGLNTSQALHTMGNKNETQRVHNTRSMSGRAASAEAEAQHAREAAVDVMRSCEARLHEAEVKAKNALADWLEETQKAIDRLEDEAMTNEKRIHNTEDALRELQKELKDLEKPMDVNAARDASRRRRLGNENIHDPVGTRLDDHCVTIARADQDLRQQIQETKQMLSQLQKRRKKLLEDLKDKTSGQTIDRKCTYGESHTKHGLTNI